MEQDQLKQLGIKHESWPVGIIGKGRPLTEVLEQVTIVAPTCSTVLLQGETGTGKELIAQAIHDASPRRQAPIIKVNCAAMPENLIESELFGHERGAFTGALTQRLGRFEVADRGTVFLDEVGDLTPEVQAKLLRVLQNQEFERLGSNRTIRVNVRLIAATHRNLAQMVREQKFRADLYYRISVFPIMLPPLRARTEDIPALVRHFVAKYSTELNKIIDDIPPETMERICTYDWPGNVRQLQNFVEYGVIVSRGARFEPPLTALRNPASTVADQARGLGGKTLDEATRQHIVLTLHQTKGVVGGRFGAAAKLGIARTTLISKMQRLGIESSGRERNDAKTARFEAIASG